MIDAALDWIGGWRATRRAASGPALTTAEILAMRAHFDEMETRMDIREEQLALYLHERELRSQHERQAE